MGGPLTTDADRLPGSEPGHARVAQDADVELVRYVRSPRDVLRLVVSAVSALVLVAAAAWAEDAILGAEQDLIQLLSFLPAPLERILARVVYLLGFAALLAGSSSRSASGGCGCSAMWCWPA